MYVEFFFHGGLCSMHKSAKRVNIGRNSETVDNLLLFQQLRYIQGEDDIHRQHHYCTKHIFGLLVVCSRVSPFR
jgi:hypothetical protein